MARDTQPTLSEASLGSDIHLQTLWAELGADAQYYVHGTDGDQMVIYLKLTKDLMHGEPYHPDLRVDVAFVLDPRDDAPSRPPQKKGSEDDTLVGMTPDGEQAYRTESRTMPEMPAVVVRSTYRPNPTGGAGDREELWFVDIKSVPGYPTLRTLRVTPRVHLIQMDERPWHLEVRMSTYDLVRRIRPAPKPLLP